MSIAEADYLMDIGPEAGEHGGKVRRRRHAGAGRRVQGEPHGAVLVMVQQERAGATRESAPLFRTVTLAPGAMRKALKPRRPCFCSRRRVLTSGSVTVVSPLATRVAWPFLRQRSKVQTSFHAVSSAGRRWGATSCAADHGLALASVEVALASATHTPAIAGWAAEAIGLPGDRRRRPRRSQMESRLAGSCATRPGSGCSLAWAARTESRRGRCRRRKARGCRPCRSSRCRRCLAQVLKLRCTGEGCQPPCFSLPSRASQSRVSATSFTRPN